MAEKYSEHIGSGSGAGEGLPFCGVEAPLRAVLAATGALHTISSERSGAK